MENILVNKKITKKFTKSILFILFVFFIGVVGVTFVLELIRAERQEIENLKHNTQKSIELFQVKMESVINSIRRTTSSSLSVNSLVDFENSGSYFKYALNDLTYEPYIEEAVVFNYSGEKLFVSSNNKSDWFSRDLVSNAISLNQGTIFSHGKNIYVIEFIKYYDTTQAGIISLIDVEKILRNSIPNEINYFDFEFSASLVVNKIPFDFSERIYSASVSDGTSFTKYNPVLTVAFPESYAYKGILHWFINILMFGVIGIIIMFFLARKLGERLARPIVMLTNKINVGTFPVSPTNTGDELEILAQAFDRATIALKKANEENIKAERRNKQQQLKAIVDTVVDGIITIDEFATIETFNPAAEKIFGYKSQEVIDRNINILVPDAYKKEYNYYIENYLQKNNKKIAEIGQEVKGLHKSGVVFPMELSVNEMDVSGKRMFTGVVRDITKRKETDRIKNEFISTVSHELRTPLTSIKGSLNLVIKKSKNLPDKLVNMLDVAQRNSERLTLLINDILDLEKLDADNIEFKYEKTNLISLVQRSLEDNEGFARAHQVTLKGSFEENNYFVKIDQHRMLQVLANLLSNAIKFSPVKGEVLVKILEKNNFYRVEVIDNGSGISPQFKKNVFKRFAQADSSDSREKGGTGLGLSISKIIVEKNFGKINYISQEGEGSTFYFELPIYHKNDEQNELLKAGVDALIFTTDQKISKSMKKELSSEFVYLEQVSCFDDLYQLVTLKDYHLLILDMRALEGYTLEWIDKINKIYQHVPALIFINKEKKCHFSNLKIKTISSLEKNFNENQLKSKVTMTLRDLNRALVLHIEEDDDITNISSSALEDIADVEKAVSISQGIEKINEKKYDIILLDLDMPDGFSEKIVEKADETTPPIIVFSAYQLDKKLHKKVDAILMKSIISNQKLESCVRGVLNTNLKSHYYE